MTSRTTRPDIEAVRGELRLERLDLLGHSHGGFVAMAWAGTNPCRVGKLILAATAARFTDVIRGARMERVASHQGRPYFDDALAALHDQQAGKYDSDEQLAALYERAAPILAPLGEDTAAVAEAFRAAGLNADALKQFNERIAPTMDLRPLLARVEAPTLVIAGDRDPFGGATVDEIAEALPDPTVVRVPGADHFIFLEPDGRPAWSRAVLEFLTG
jgi:proline iminopeptidase